MKIRFAIIFSVLFVQLGCKESISTNDLISDVKSSYNEVQADGSTIVNLSAILNNDLDIRNVLFKTDKGTFPDNKDADSIIVIAEKVAGQLTAFTHFKAPSSPGDITITVQVLIPDHKGEFVFTKTILSTKSVPYKINLTASSFSVYNNFNGEVQLTGKLLNYDKSGVSTGYGVIINDVYENYLPVNGVFRNSSLVSNKNSEVNATYTPGWINSDQSVLLIMTVVDDTGHKTNISDTIKIAVIPKN